MSGPVQVIAASFQLGTDFERRVVAGVDRLRGRGVLRLLDMLAVDEAAEVISAAQEDEARATLAAIAAEDRAAEAVETAMVIRAAAVADAVSALITAGLIRESAAHEAIDAMRVAGLLVAAADEMGAEAVAEGAAVIRAASITLAQANVLRYLPTTLSFADIAHELGISRGAAKERAERAYNKLGVHSRAEAVTRARDLHLIG